MICLNCTVGAHPCPETRTTPCDCKTCFPGKRKIVYKKVNDDHTATIKTHKDVSALPASQHA